MVDVHRKHFPSDTGMASPMPQLSVHEDSKSQDHTSDLMERHVEVRRLCGCLRTPGF